MGTAAPLGEEPPRLFAERGCPFAHRVLALADHLAIALDIRSSVVGDHPDGIEQHAVSAPVPLLVHGGLVLTESRVMLEHLAAHAGFTEALPPDLPSRTLHQHAMALMDGTLTSSLLSGATLDPRRLRDTLDGLAMATELGPPVPNLLAFHLAPIWRAGSAWQPGTPTVAAITARPALARWLTAAAELPSVQRTAPDPRHELEDLERARAAGLFPERTDSDTESTRLP